MDELNRYIENIDTLINKLSPTERTALSRQIGMHLRQKNKQRIRVNVAPDGASFTPRQNRDVASRAFSGSLKTEQDFVYAGKLQRYRTLRDYGDYYIGWNYRTRKTFKAMKNKVRLPSRSIRQKLMFRKIHQYKYLQMKATSHEAAIGFMTGLTAYIAAAHQYGEDNRPQRELLGFADDDLQMIEQMLISHFEK